MQVALKHFVRNRAKKQAAISSMCESQLVKENPKTQTKSVLKYIPGQH